MNVVVTPKPAQGVDLRFVDDAVRRAGSGPDAAIPILQAIQEHFGYLPTKALEHVCEHTRITPAAIAGISTFYDMFRHEPVGKHLVRVCHGTACHVTGAERIEDALRRRLGIPPGQDTDPDGEFTMEPVACLGCCTLAPVVKVGGSTFGHLSVEKVDDMVGDYLASHHENPVNTEILKEKSHHAPVIRVHVGLGSCCIAKGSDRLFQALQESAEQTGSIVEIKRVGCVGMCHQTPLVEIDGAGHSGTRFYAGLTPDNATHLIERHLPARTFGRKIGRLWNKALDALLLDTTTDSVTCAALPEKHEGMEAFLGCQVHIATEHFGKLDPLDLDEYLRHDGFNALRDCLAKADPESIVETVVQSGLRGRGGAGFPTGQKWRVMRQQQNDTKYVICNGDEGDPGAFMDRMLLESFPYRIIEGMAIAAVATGAHDAVFYIRHEYPLAVHRIRLALETLRKRGWIGDKLLDSPYPLRFSIKEGAGAFVCGEETALIASIEGKRGMPRLRPPFPAQSGLWAKPTLINNVETLAMVPWILRNGAKAFAAHGTANSKGTKVFALAGKVQRGGLIEVPMGTTIRQIVEDIGGGAPDGRKFKAVQIGGPSGGCVPASLADTPVDYESLRNVGAIIGSGGLVVLDDSDCMVDIARYFLKFTQDQSCGKCTFCRVGTRRMLDILERICAGKGLPQHLDELETLAAQVAAGSLCGLGKTAPNPILTTLRYYRSEYEAHLKGHCPAGRCQALIHYRVTDACTGCTLCAQACPVQAIPMTPYRKHRVIDEACTRCDSCRRVCPHGAVEVR